MNITKTILTLNVIALTTALFLAGPAVGTAATKKTADTDAAHQPLIQMAILLDTSGSMSGLINQARAQVWMIVNDLAKATVDGVQPKLQIALYEYGNDGLVAKEGYLRMIVPLSDDLDLLSDKLFKLTTNGGSEYCGWVIQSAVNGLQWSERDDDLKLIFIAGNESFKQGSVSYVAACKAAIAKGIIVNTIHCGNESTGRQSGWSDGAALADGRFMSLNHNQAIVSISAPQDKEIVALNGKLNKTYVAFGKNGAARLKMQVTNDTQSARISVSNLADRTSSKASRYYGNDSWDLVDACEKDLATLSKLKDEDLPEDMKGMSVAERKAFITKKKQERETIKTAIQKLGKEREQYIAEAREKLADTGADSIDALMIKAIRAQAGARNFGFTE